MTKGLLNLGSELGALVGDYVGVDSVEADDMFYEEIGGFLC